MSFTVAGIELVEVRLVMAVEPRRPVSGPYGEPEFPERIVASGPSQ